jgi:hypothetical protein
MWKDAMAIAQQAVVDANDQIARVSDERGVPKEFRPRVDLAWTARGINSDPARRAELRKLAVARVDAIGKQAKLTIDAQVGDTVADLLAGALTSEAAVAHLRTMADPRRLMPQLEVAELQQAYERRRSS